MKKKDKKKLKKKDKRKGNVATESQSGNWSLKQQVKTLKAELTECKSTIEALKRQLKERKSPKKKSGQQAKGTSKIFQAQLTDRVAVDQRKAWKRHGYLRERYEFHLENGQDKSQARLLADKDLRAEFGADAGYTAQELEQILS